MLSQGAACQSTTKGKIIPDGRHPHGRKHFPNDRTTDEKCRHAVLSYRPTLWRLSFTRDEGPVEVTWLTDRHATGQRHKKTNSQQWRSSQAAPLMQQQSQYLDSKSIQYIWNNKIAGRNTLKCLRLQIQFKVKHLVKNVFQGWPEFNKKATVEKWKYKKKNGNNNFC